jgi:GTP-binding protein
VEAAFLLSAAAKKQFPEPLDFEVFVLGRSNCGKSSLLNRWLGRKAMARVGGTPGRTRLANFFRVVFSPSDPPMLVCDLPGYGYASAPKATVEGWRTLLSDYLSAARGPRLALLLMDIRRKVQAEEINLAGWLASLSLSYQVVATKSDKLTPNARRKALKALGTELGGSPLAFSSLTGQGREELISLVAEARRSFPRKAREGGEGEEAEEGAVGRGLSPLA